MRHWSEKVQKICTICLRHEKILWESFDILIFVSFLFSIFLNLEMRIPLFRQMYIPYCTALKSSAHGFIVNLVKSVILF